MLQALFEEAAVSYDDESRPDLEIIAMFWKKKDQKLPASVAIPTIHGWMPNVYLVLMIAKRVFSIFLFLKNNIKDREAFISFYKVFLYLKSKKHRISLHRKGFLMCGQRAVFSRLTMV
ncbi:unnamed protein product [Rhizopus stolonifer]